MTGGQGAGRSSATGQASALSVAAVAEYYCALWDIGVFAFHAGTVQEGEATVTAGGRVIAVSAYAPTLREALDLVYAGVERVSFEGKTFRRDIAHRCVYISDVFACAPDTIGLIGTASALQNEQAAPGLTYAQAGVSVDAGNSLVEAIKPLVRATRRPGADAEIGGFGGVFDLKAVGYTDPVLVSGTDGVGTKLRVAMDAGIHDSVGTSPSLLRGCLHLHAGHSRGTSDAIICFPIPRHRPRRDVRK